MRHSSVDGSEGVGEFAGVFGFSTRIAPRWVFVLVCRGPMATGTVRCALGSSVDCDFSIIIQIISALRVCVSREMSAGLAISSFQSVFSVLPRMFGHACHADND